MGRRHDLVGYSSFPFATSPKDEVEIRARKFNFAFKNGRGYSFGGKQMTYGEVLGVIVRDARRCPAFAEPAVLVPIPRSGNSRPSYASGASRWPGWDLASALQRGGNVAVELLERTRPVRCSSANKTRVPITEHLSSMAARRDERYLGRPIVLLDDNLVQGTQSMASQLKLREAGYTGPIVAYFVSQTLARYQRPEQQLRWQTHRIVWSEGDRHASRGEVGRWHVAAGEHQGEKP